MFALYGDNVIIIESLMPSIEIMGVHRDRVAVAVKGHWVDIHWYQTVYFSYAQQGITEGVIPVQCSVCVAYNIDEFSKELLS